MAAGKSWLKSITLTFCLALMAIRCLAQEAPTGQQSKEQESRETQAYALLDQVITDSHNLRLPENRINVLTSAGQLLWKRDEVRARALLNETAAVVRGMFNALDPKANGFQDEYRAALESRRSFLVAVSELDPKLAYDLMIATRPDGDLQPPQTGRGGQTRSGFNPNSESDLEMRLLAEIAESDPTTVIRDAREMMDKGQFPNSLTRALEKLRGSNQPMAEKLSDILIEKLTAETLTKQMDAGNLAISLLRPGPIPPKSSDQVSSAQPAETTRYLGESAYQKLLLNMVTAGLGYQPPANTNNQRGGGRRGVPGAAARQDPAQFNAFRIYNNLFSLVPQIEKYLPAKAPLVKQKLSQGSDAARMQQRQVLSELSTLMSEGSVESILQAAGKAPPEFQPRFYQQAAIKAINEGRMETAEEISGRFLSETQRTQIAQVIERQKAGSVALAGNLDQLRVSLQKLRNDDQRVEMLTRLAVDAWRQKNESLARELINETRSMVTGQARDYGHMESQLKVVRAYAEIDPAEGFEILGTVVARLNDLIPAAATLSGFEVRIFKDGELPLTGYSSLHQMITAIGYELGRLSLKDFDRARTIADQLQQTESRIIARLSVIRGALGQEQSQAFAGSAGPDRNFGQRGGIRRP